jgi:hypothetical protein
MLPPPFFQSLESCCGLWQLLRGKRIPFNGSNYFFKFGLLSGLGLATEKAKASGKIHLTGQN